MFSRIHEWKFSGPDGPIRFFQIGKVYGNFMQLEIFRILMGWILWKSGRFADGAPPFNSEVVKAAYLKDIAPYLASVTPGFS